MSMFCFYFVNSFIMKIKREVNRIRIYECRCDERLKVVPLRDLHVSHTLGYVGDSGTRTPKDRDEVT